MPGYADTKQLIESTLTGRPAGTYILPEDHQTFALSLLDYIHAVELIGASSLQGTATTSTVPVEPANSKVSYIGSVPPGQTYVYANFKDENNQAISVTSSANTVSLITLLWNGSYWSVSVTPVTLAVDYSNGYLFMGMAVPTTNPGTPDQNVFYVASTAGTYTNFGGLTVADGEVAILRYNGSWTKDVTGAATKEELTRLEAKVDGENVVTDYVPKLVLYGSGTSINPRYNADWITTGKIPVSNNDVVKVVFNRSGASGTNIVTLYNSSNAVLGAYSSSGYTNVRDNMSISDNSASYIRCCMDYTNRANGEVYVNGKLVWKYSTPKSIDERLSELEQSKENLIFLHLDDLIQAGLSSGVPAPSSSSASMRVSVNSAVCFPKQGTWHISLPFGIDVAIAGFNSSVGGVTDSGWLSDGDTYQVSTQQVYRCVFRVGNGNQSLPVDYIKELVSGGQIAIYANSDDVPVVERNAHRQDELQAMGRVLVTPSADNKADALPLFAHISDLHGDIQRLYNCFDYCSGIKPIAVLNSGDVVVYRGDRDYSTFQVVAAKKYDSDYLFCIGNHEASLTGQNDLFAKNISALATQYEYLATPNVVTTDCYYYKDYATEKVRVIVLNYYDAGTYAGRLGQAQITWFCNTLLSTPSGYGILIMLHSPEDYVDAPEGLKTFFQTKSIVGAMSGVSVGGRIVMKIVDAFISRGTISETYEESNGDSVAVSADFSSVDSSTEFIAYITGHRHEDNVGYYRHSTNMQLCLCVTSGNALYGDSSNPAWANQEDLPRGGTGISQDAFNLYAIDRVNKRVKIMRIGADVTQDLENRKVMAIPYIPES